MKEGDVVVLSELDADDAYYEDKEFLVGKKFIVVDLRWGTFKAAEVTRLLEGDHKFPIGTIYHFSSAKFELL